MTARGDSLRCSRNPGSNFRSGLIAPREYRPRCRRRRRVAKVSCTAGPAKSDGNFKESNGLFVRLNLHLVVAAIEILAGFRLQVFELLLVLGTESGGERRFHLPA